MLPDSSLFYFVTALVILLIGLSKGGFGGIGGAATPIMALVLPPEQAIGLLLPLLMLADVFAVTAHWRNWDRRLLLLLLPATVVGITAGTALITVLSSEALRIGLAIFVLLFASYRLFETRIRTLIQYRTRGWHGALAGGLAGFTSTVAHAGGPPIAIYLILQDVTPAVFVATMNGYFFVTNWLKLPYYLWSGILELGQIRALIWLLPLLPAGVWIGRWLVTRIEKKTFDRLILVLLVVSAVLLLTR